MAGYAQNFDTEFDIGPFSTDPKGGEAETQTRAIRAYGEQTDGAVDHNFAISRFDIDRTSKAGGFSDPFGGTRDRVDYTATWAMSQALTPAFGADWTRDEVSTTGSIFDPVTFARTGSATDNAESETTGHFAGALYAPTDTLDLSL